MSRRRGTFRADELHKVPEPINPVVLKSGGPVMSAEPLEDSPGNLLCSYEEGGKLARAVFPEQCVYRCVPYRGE